MTRPLGERTLTAGFYGPKNLVVQALGAGMIDLAALSVLPWSIVLGWTVLVALAVLAEDRVLAHSARTRDSKRGAGPAAGAMRVVVTTIYAIAAFVLIARGGPGERLFGFAIVSASMVHILMRHYRSPLVLAACLVPWAGILGLVGFGLAKTALQAGEPLRALSCTFVIAMLAVEFWSAREQLSAAWHELMALFMEVSQAEGELKETQRIAKIGSWRLAPGDSRPHWSPEIYEIFGLDPAGEAPSLEEILPLIDADSQSRVSALFESDTQETFNFTLRLNGPDGAQRVCWLEARADIAADGTRVGLCGFCQDITEREAAAAQLRQAQKMESVGQLTGGLAHDFNNLLAIVIGNLDLISENLEAGSAEQEFAETALQAALKGSELTKQLLAFSRRQTLDPKVVDLNALVDGMAPLLRRTLGEDITVKLALTPDLWLTKLDAPQMESALLNLVINARDAMPEGGTLTVETGNVLIDPDDPDLPPGEYALVAVSDTGGGMPPEVLSRVVEPFFTTKGVGKGSGLGLSMIYGFAKQSGGQLRIYSEVGHGTIVRLYLARSQEAPVSTVREPPRPVKGRGERILVVEDNADVRRVAVRQLTDLGYEVIEADSGASGLAALAQDHGVDLVFSDIVMPGGMTGLEMMQTARAERPELKALFTTGFSAAAAANNRVMGADPVISKPYRVAELAAKLREALAGEVQEPESAAVTAVS